MTRKGFTLIELPVVRKRAFTLIELLIVIAIIGILSTIVIISITGAQEKARDVMRKNDLRSVKSALALYYSDYEQYVETSNNEVWEGFSANLSGGLVSNYIKSLPFDPQTENGENPPYQYMTHNGDSVQFVEFALECVLERDEKDSGDAEEVSPESNTYQVNFVVPTQSTLGLSSGYNYALTSD